MASVVRAMGGPPAAIALAVLLAAVAMLAVLGAMSEPSSTAPSTAVDNLVPDVAALVAVPSEVDDEWLGAAVADLGDVDGVLSATVGWPDADHTAFYLRIDETAVARRSLDRITADVESGLAEAGPFDNDLTVVLDGDLSDSDTDPDPAATEEAVPEILIGGRAVVDRQLASSYQATVVMLALVAGLCAIGVGFRFGRWEALLAAAVLPLAVLLAGAVGGRAATSFNGTIATTPVVAAVAGLVAAVVLAARVLLWFESPVEDDGAAMVRASLGPVGLDLMLVTSGFLAVLGVVWLFGGAVAALVAVVVGTTIGSLFVAAVLTTMLAGFRLARPNHMQRPWRWGPNVDRPAGGHLLPFTVPTGERLRLVVILGLGGLLLLLSGFALRTAGLVTLDHSNLESASDAYRVGEILARTGDPTQAVVTLVNDDSGQWTEQTASNPSVAWVDRIDGRYSTGGRRDAVEGASLLSQSVLASLASGSTVDGLAESVSVPQRALVVPAVPMRSAEGQALLSDLEAAPAQVVSIDGPVVDGHRSQSSRLLLISTLALLSIVAGLAVYVVTERVDQAVTTSVLRLVGGAGMAGMYSLVTGRPPGLEILSVVVLLALSSGLFELEFLRDRRAALDPTGVTTGYERGARFRPAGQVGFLACGLIVVAGLVTALSLWFGSTAPTGRFGIGLMLVGMVELTVVTAILVPVLLGQTAAFHGAVRPLRRAVVPGRRNLANRDSGPADPSWHRIASDLLLAEFLLESDPAQARPEQVYLADTPAHLEAVERIDRLRANGLRVSGRSPAVRLVRTAGQNDSHALDVTVDDPERHLVDQNGRVHGVRSPRRRSLALWLAPAADGGYRVAELLETGSVPSPQAPPPEPTEQPPSPSLVGSGDHAAIR